MSRIAVFGGGYVGLVTAACFAELGHDVVVRDIVPEKIDALRRGEVPIYEPGLDALLVRQRGAPTLHARRPGRARRRRVRVRLRRHAADVLGRRRSVPRMDGRRRAAGGHAGDDRHEVDRAGRARARRFARRSTRAGSKRSAMSRIPEFTAEGTAVRDFMEPDRIVIGAFEGPTAMRSTALHAGSTRPSCARTSAPAEMIKLAANAFLMTRDLVHQRDRERLRAHRRRRRQSVAEGVGLDHRLGPHFLRAGLGLRRLVLPEGLARAEAARRRTRATTSSCSRP